MKIILRSLFLLFFIGCTIAMNAQDVQTFVWEDTNGDGIQDGGENLISGVTVEIFENIGGLSLGTFTEVGGQYEFTGLVSGIDYYIIYTILMPDMDAFTIQNAGGVTDDSNAPVGTGPSWQTPPFTFNGTLIEDIDVGMISSTSLCGTVFLDEDGNGEDNDGMDYSNVTIDLAHCDGSPVLDLDGMPYTTQISPGGNGDYCFDDLPPGDYNVTFTTNDGTFFLTEMDATAGDTDDSDPDQTSGETDCITITSSQPDLAHTDAGYYQEICISDMVFEDCNGNGVFDPGTDMELDGWVVNITNGDGSQTVDLDGNNVNTTTTAGGGLYGFCNLPPGVYDIEFELMPDFFFTNQDNPGNPTGTDGDSDPAGDPSTNGEVDDIVALSGQDIESVDAGVYQEFTIGGVIYADSNMSGGFDGGDNIFPNISMQITDCNGNVVAGTTSGPSGEYSVDLPPGMYIVSILPVNFSAGGGGSLALSMPSAVGAGANAAVDNDNDGIGTDPLDANGVSTDCIDFTCPNYVPGTLDTSVDFGFDPPDCGSQQQMDFITPICQEIEDNNTETLCDLNLLDGFCGTMFAGDSGGSQPGPLCPGGGTVHNITWYAFVAGQGNFQIEFSALNCTTVGNGFTGMQVGIYDDCSFTNSIWCMPDCATGIIETNATWVPGQTYYVFFDGCAGSVCDFEINLIGSFNPFNFIPPPVAVNGNCDPDPSGFPLCTGASLEFFPDGLQNLSQITSWFVTSDSGVNEEFIDSDVVLNYTFPQAGEYTIRYNIDEPCKSGSEVINVTVVDIANEILTHPQVCSGEVFAGIAAPDVNGDGLSWQGGNITAPPNTTGAIITETVTFNATTSCGCPYDQIMTFDVLPQSAIGQPEFILCQSELDAFTYEGIDIDNATPNGLNINLTLEGSPSVTDVDGCDSIVDLTVHVIELDGMLEQAPCSGGFVEVSFDQTALVLPPSADAASLTYTWLDGGLEIADDGDGNPEILTVGPTDANIIDLQITVTGPDDPANPGTPLYECVFLINPSIVIVFDNPDEAIFENTLPLDGICIANPMASYTVTNEAGNTYNWTVTGGAITAGQGTNEIMVDWTGATTGEVCVTVIDGCGLESFPVCELVDVIDVPVGDFTMDVAACFGGDVTIEYTGVQDPIYTYNWDFGTDVPTGVVPDGPGPFTVAWDSEGVKTVSLVIESAPGCESVATMKMVTIESALMFPMLTCAEFTDMIVFSWPLLAEATGYVVDMTTAPAGAMGVLDDAAGTYTVTGLTQGESVTIEVFATTNSICGDTDVVSLTCTAQNCNLPNITLTPSETEICVDALSTNITVVVDVDPITPGSGVFSGIGVNPSTGEVDIFTQNAGVIDYTYTLDDGCVATASTTVLINASPILLASSQMTEICITETYEVTVNVSSGIPIFTENTNALTETAVSADMWEFTWDTPGMKTLTVIAQDGNCESTEETLMVNVVPEVQAPIIMCNPQLDQVEFTWADVDNVSSYDVVVTAGPTGTQIGNTYVVTGLSEGESVTIEVTAISDNLCPSVTTDFTCTASACPTISVDADAVGPICLDAASTDLSGTILVDGSAPVDGTIEWSGMGITDTTNGTFDPSVAGVGTWDITLQYIDGTGACPGSDIISIVVDAPLDDLIVNCTAQDIDFVTFEWNSIPGVTEYEVTVNNMTINQPETIFTVNNLSVGDVINISVTALSENTCMDVTGTSSCSASDCPDIEVMVDAVNPICLEGSVTPITLSGTVLVDGGAPTGGTTTWSGVGITDADNGIFDPNVAGVGLTNITLSYVDDSGACSSSRVVMIEILGGLEAPVITCMSTLNSVEFSWDPVANASEYEVTINGNTTTQTGTTIEETGLSEGDVVVIVVVAISNNGCANSMADASCEAMPCPNIIIVPNATDFNTCKEVGGVVSLGVIISNSDGSGTGTWSGTSVSPEGAIEIASIDPGLYNYTYMYTEMGCDFSITIPVEIYGTPTLSVDVVNPDCYLLQEGNAVVTPTLTTANFVLSLNNNEIGSETMLTGLVPANYDIQITDDNGCTSSESFVISAAAEPEAVITGSATIVNGQSATYSIDPTIAAGITNIVWTNNGDEVCNGMSCEEITLTPTEDGELCVEVFYETNCSVSACRSYDVQTIENYYFPNTFSPNEDGENDEWVIFSSDSDTRIEDFVIYDRWGNLIQEISGTEIGAGIVLWDGKYNQELVQPGVYVYYMKIIPGNGNDPVTISDSVTILR